MSGIVKGVKKIFKNKVVRAIVVAAVVWFTVGTAMNYFAVGEAGMAAGTAGSWSASAASQASTMWTSVTGAATAEASATGATEAAAEGAAMMETGGAVEAGTVAETAATTTEVSSIAGGETAGSYSLAESSVAEGTLDIGATTGAGESSTGLVEWAKKNPMATMVLGQAGAGAYGGYLADKEAERQADADANRGLFGMDQYGNFGGIVRNRMPVETEVDASAPTAPPVSASTAPVVTPQTVQNQPIAAPQAQPVQVPRNRLPQIQAQGQITKRAI